MKEDKSSYLTYLDFLDDVLYSIHHRINNIENLQFPDNPEIPENPIPDGERTYKALNFLESENYIKKDNPYSITYKGILKLSEKGFVQEYEDNEENRKFLKAVNKSTKFYNYITIVIAIIALLVSIFKNCA